MLAIAIVIMLKKIMLLNLRMKSYSNPLLKMNLNYKKIENFHERKILTFGRRRGRAISDMQQQLFDEVLPDISISPDQQINELLVGDYQEFHMEIGFGDGERLAKVAQNNPQNLYFGCEPYLNGVGCLLRLIKQNDIKNIKIWTDDARDLLEKFPSQSLTKIYILFPDPWPKAKHHKRRIINNEMLKLLSIKLKTSGEVLMATDHTEYAKWILEHFTKSELFNWPATSKADWQDEPEGWVKTRYQQKAESQGIKSNFFRFIKSI
jgi:tRNA (guanine-N7-)-methyltransferase